MALAKKCDRCGKYYDKVNAKYYTEDGFYVGKKTDYTTYRTEFIDLCEGCLDQFNDWLKKEIKANIK